METNTRLQELFMKLFRNINTIEEKAVAEGKFRNLTVNDIHVIEVIGIDVPKNMSSVAKALSVTMGTLTIAVNSLVKKGFVERVRSEEDRRVVLIFLTTTGKEAYINYKKFYRNMIISMTEQLSDKEKEVCIKMLASINVYFQI